MKNKLTALLLLITGIASIYGMYYYFFILNKGDLLINTNIKNYDVSLYNKKLKIKFNHNCLEKICKITDIASFDYEIEISKTGYKSIRQNIKVEKNKELKINFNLEKDLVILKVNETKKDEKTSKIDELREINLLKKNYAFFNLDNLGYFYFIDNLDDTIKLFWQKDKKDTFIYSFNKVLKKEINIIPIDMSENELLISIGDEKYIFNLDNFLITKTFFPQNIVYAKYMLNNYYFITKNGSYLYNLQTNKFEYFYLFKDFLMYDSENYLGIIYDNEIEKKKNYNLQDFSGNLIVKYNYKTKKIKVLKDTSIIIEKLVLNDDKIYIYNSSGDKYLVYNIE
ncbi:PEGA domain-containing protein [Candidatus Gracilibacteria bacterium]|nr:PEGA domain-containing protein [Candidatus Gracilibacteria bacterium]